MALRRLALSYARYADRREPDLFAERELQVEWTEDHVVDLRV
jgi:hypothetical protein